MVKNFEAIIIGAGQAGAPLAQKLAARGIKTAVIERLFVGGTCINDGCTPTKSWVASADAAYAASRAANLGIDIPLFKVNMAKIKARKDEIVRSFREGGEQRLKHTPNLELIYGEASFLDDKTISVKQADGELVLVADKIFVNAGCRPFIPNIPGIEDIQVLTSHSILELEYIPEHLLIIGGGYIALEFGQMFRRFGSTVTIAYRGGQLASQEDPDIAGCLEEIFKLEGINLVPFSQPTRFRKLSEQHMEATVSVNGETQYIKCSHVLFATGRIPNTETLGLENKNIKLNDLGYIEVDERLETSVPGVYALGDINGGPAFTHTSYHDFTIVYRNLFENGGLSTRDRLVPYCIFTDPPLGRVGFTELKARIRGLNFRVVTLPVNYIARAVEKGDTRGFIKVIVDTDSKLILGVAALCADGGELMTILHMAMAANITYLQLKYWIFAHPLYAESINNLFGGIE